MKQSSNNYLFNKFNVDYQPESVSKSTLTIKDIYNLKTDNNVIEPICKFSNIFELFFTNPTIIAIKNKFRSVMSNILKVYLYEYFDETSSELIKRIFIIDKQFKFYEIDGENQTLIDYDLQFDKMPLDFNINNKLYFCSSNNLNFVISEDNNPIVLTDIVNLKSIINFNNYTLFNCSENKFSFYYTESTELANLESNLNNYNQISLPQENGELEKILIYKNNIYAIQKYAILKIIIDENGYKIQNSCSIKSAIDADTIELIDDYIIFLSSNGLYLFDGNDIKQIFKNYTINLIHSNNKSVAFNNKYYLKTNYYIDDIKESVILEFDIENNYCTFHKIGELIDIYCFQNISIYKFIAICEADNDNTSALYLNDTIISQVQKHIEFNKLTFDDTPIKVLNELKILSYGTFYVTISSEIQSSIFKIEGVSYIKNIGIKGQAFSIKIESNSNFIIQSIYIKTTPYDED